MLHRFPFNQTAVTWLALGLNPRAWLALVVLLSLLLISVFCCAQKALSVCTLIPDRKQTLCESLGYGVPCKLVYEAGKVGHGVLEITVDSDVSAESTNPSILGVQAVQIHLTVEGETISQIYQRIEGPGAWALAAGLQRPPCLYDNKCSDPASEGLSEAELLDITYMVEHLIWQTPDAEITKALQRLYQTRGIPTITNVYPEESYSRDETSSTLPSVFRIPIEFQFILAKRK